MTRICAHCGDTFAASRRDAIYCTTRCRAAAHAERKRTLPVPSAPLPLGEPGQVEAALRAHLVARDVIDDALAPAALALARRLDNDTDSLSGMAAAIRALESVVGAMRPPTDRLGVDTVDFLRFVRAVRQVDPDVALAVRAVIPDDVREQMARNARRRYGFVDDTATDDEQ